MMISGAGEDLDRHRTLSPADVGTDRGGEKAIIELDLARKRRPILTAAQSSTPPST